MKIIIVAAALLTGSAAIAQAPADYPPCSKSVMDKCTETGMKMSKPMMHHKKKMKAHHKMAKKPMAAPAPAPAPAGQ